MHDAFEHIGQDLNQGTAMWTSMQDDRPDSATM